MVNSGGAVIVPMRDWASFFASKFKKVSGIKKTHHFHVTTGKPGVIATKLHSDSKQEEINILKDGVVVDPLELPPEKVPTGLSAQRQWYLFDKIRVLPCR